MSVCLSVCWYIFQSVECLVIGILKKSLSKQKGERYKKKTTENDMQICTTLASSKSADTNKHNMLMKFQTHMTCWFPALLQKVSYHPRMCHFFQYFSYLESRYFFVAKSHNIVFFISNTKNLNSFSLATICYVIFIVPILPSWAFF